MKVQKSYAKNEKVVFVGATGEVASKKAKTVEWLKAREVPWKAVVGNRKLLGAYKLQYYPTTYVIGADGKVAWHSFMKDGKSVEDAIAAALKASS